MDAYAGRNEDGGGRRRGVDHITESWTSRKPEAKKKVTITIHVISVIRDCL